MIPWSTWRNNDLWNLLPCDSKLNNQKIDKLPSSDLINKRFDCQRGSIIEHWEIIMNKHEDLFKNQAKMSFGSDFNFNDLSKNKELLIQLIIKNQLRFGNDWWDK